MPERQSDGKGSDSLAGEKEQLSHVNCLWVILPKRGIFFCQRVLCFHKETNTTFFHVFGKRSLIF
jgi:hypothetical protein